LSAPSGALGLCPRCLAADGDEESSLPELSGITLESELGRGGMGRVFRARHERLQRVVAVKLLPPELSWDPEFEARFSREARALARLSHPNLLQVHDFGSSADGASYLVMEFAAGGTLAERIPLAPAEALRVALELCAGLCHVHERGLVHRDIKPENVLFDAQGTAKLADFGVARLWQESGAAPLTNSVHVLGTPGYIAPEAARGAPPDPRFDVYSLGVLLHQMLSGRLPGHTKEELPAPFASVVRRALAENPDERFSSALELQRALGGARASLQTPTAPAELGAWLPPEELSWQRAVALTLAGATAISLYAVLVSVTPRVLDAGDALPFIAFGAERLADGRLATQARFETGATLAAAAGWAVALATYGLLRRHWRHAGLELPNPERPLPSVRAVLVIAAIIDVLFLVRLVLQRSSARALAPYVPVLGGVLELGMLYLFWMVVLDALRSHRPLAREPLLWVGVTLSLLPPLDAVLRSFAGQTP
jgi:serine/threonine-protein kinase